MCPFFYIYSPSLGSLGCFSSLGSVMPALLAAKLDASLTFINLSSYEKVTHSFQKNARKFLIYFLSVRKSLPTLASA